MFDIEQKFYIRQRFVIKYEGIFESPEMFELVITKIDDQYIHCDYVYLEYDDSVSDGGEGSCNYSHHIFDEMIDESRRNIGGWEMVSESNTIKPIVLPEELFNV